MRWKTPTVLRKQGSIFALQGGSAPFLKGTVSGQE